MPGKKYIEDGRDVRTVRDASAFQDQAALYKGRVDQCVHRVLLQVNKSLEGTPTFEDTGDMNTYA